MFRTLYILTILLLTSGRTATAELLPVGDWPGDGTRTALQIGDELFRNAGRILERWDLASIPPMLLDSLVLPSPAVALLDWNGLLLVKRQDGILEARDLSAGWDSPVWSLPVSGCGTELLRHGRWLLPISPGMHVIDLDDPSTPVVQDLGWFGGYHAAFVGDILFGDMDDCCGICWDSELDVLWLSLPPDTLGGAPASVPWEVASCWQWDYRNVPVASANGRGLVRGWNQLSCFDPGTWTVLQSLPLQPVPGLPLLAARDTLALVGSGDQTLLLSVSVGAEVPLQLLDSIAMVADQHLILQDSHAWAVSRDRVERINLDDPSDIVVDLDLPAQGEVRALAWAGDLLLSRQRRLQVFSTTEDELRLVASLELGEGRQLAGRGQLALADVTGGVAVLDLADPEAPRVAAVVPAPDLRRLAMLEELGVWQEGGDLVFVDLRNPDQPVERARFAQEGITGLDALGEVAAVGVGGQGVHLFRATLDGVVPGAWVETGTHPFALVDDRLVHSWVGGDSLHMVVTCVAEPANPLPEFSQYIPWVLGATLHGGLDRLGVLIRPYNPIWPGDEPSLRFYDLVEGQALVPCGSLGLDIWDVEMWNWPEPFLLSRDAASAGRLAQRLPWDGVGVYFDTTLLPVEAPARPTQPALAAAPNPFNPRTLLNFTLERPGPARLAVYDLLGREMEVLLNGPQPAGIRQVAFDGAGLASGIYLGMLETAEETVTIKLILLR